MINYKRWDKYFILSLIKLLYNNFKLVNYFPDKTAKNIKGD
jgi:hypothetical protein